MDQQILFLINRTWTHPAMDRVMAVVSSLDFWWPILVVLGILAFVFGGFRMRMALLAGALAVGVTDGLVVGTLKDLVSRPRPNDWVGGVRSLDLAEAAPRFLAIGMPLRENVSEARIRPPTGSSFPSGHTSNLFAVAAVGVVFFRKWGWLLVLPALLVSYSRIYVGSHWPSDVAASIFIGSGLGILTAVALAAAWRYWGGKLLPGVHAHHPELLTA